MLFFLLPPSIRAKIGPRLRIGLGASAAVVGIVASSHIVLVSGVLVMVWGLVGVAGQVRHRFPRRTGQSLGVR